MCPPQPMPSLIPYVVTLRCPAKKWTVVNTVIHSTASGLKDLESQLLCHFKTCDESVAMSVIWSMLSQEPKKEKPDYSFENFMYHLQNDCASCGELPEGTTFMESCAFIDGEWVKDPVGTDAHFYKLALSEMRHLSSTSTSRSTDPQRPLSK